MMKSAANSKPDNNGTPSMRLDKWLWCARFFKTRGLTADAIKSGKIMIRDERAKPSRMISPGMQLKIKRAPYQFDITILELPGSRVPANQISRIYQETGESMQRREKLSVQLKMDAMGQPRTDGRPSKRERRDLMRFKTGRQE